MASCGAWRDGSIGSQPIAPLNRCRVSRGRCTSMSLLVANVRTFGFIGAHARIAGYCIRGSEPVRPRMTPGVLGRCISSTIKASVAKDAVRQVGRVRDVVVPARVDGLGITAHVHHVVTCGTGVTCVVDDHRLVGILDVVDNHVIDIVGRAIAESHGRVRCRADGDEIMQGGHPAGTIAAGTIGGDGVAVVARSRLPGTTLACVWRWSTGRLCRRVVTDKAQRNRGDRCIDS
jgi:hypothetical protein